MLNISLTQPVAWPPPPASPAVAPVASVSAVTPARGLLRDGQPNPGAGGEERQTASRELQRKAPPEPQAAPILPRENAQDGPGAAHAAAQPDASEERETLAQAAEKLAQKRQFQDVLSSVWKASAAVVDVVLGREPSADAAVKAAGADPQADTALPQRGAAQAGRDPDADEGWAPAGMLSEAGQAEPVAYTEQGTSTWAALETGTLVNRKV